MFPARFEYAVPTSLDEAVGLLQASAGQAKLLAGGHSLLPLMKLGLAEPATLIDIGRLRELAYVRSEDGGLAIGASTTHHTLETSAEVGRVVPVIAEAAALIGDVQVRNRGTIGGSMAHADPGADLPAVLLALGAELIARGPDGRRVIAVDDFFVGMLTTALRPDEILVEIRIPAPPAGSGAAYEKFPHPASRYALVGIGAAVQMSGATIAGVRIGVTGVSTHPYRARAVESALAGVAAAGDMLDEAASRVTEGADVQDDLQASREYRTHLAQVCTVRALQRAMQQARR